ncbi:hypothetical protein P9B97_02375 [Bacillus paralicheniformis]|uniref:hypothetical protein n=1 Tax=Bacillus paralicheniformis TaxID=1648923 RepID=UPI002DB723EE|nr:hypothetical protein [Bacillus paralicheniformis]MEC1050928.1 hypothetical protein [Bacillus paralicheniformis]MEC1085040.1 hypothetical protein [Bacillus paralicheniformis]MEC1108840.1 hypothetical protein [Bacillus paralicheniformis]MEC1137182.1 hypothetical protein [Bacillus paralicheniformis]MEC1148063.1 hypothetical protein [Bacillus paralicheniformis]
MIKYAIRLHNNSQDAHLIFHATPDLTHYNWQWYLTEDKKHEGKPIKGEFYQSYGTTTDLIKKFGEEGKYIYCKYIDRNTHQEYKSELIRLYSDINKIINSGTLFDDISEYDENGDIINKGAKLQV